jgi:hypothetical protein
MLTSEESPIFHGAIFSEVSVGSVDSDEGVLSLEDTGATDEKRTVHYSVTNADHTVPRCDSDVTLEKSGSQEECHRMGLDDSSSRESLLELVVGLRARVISLEMEVQCKTREAERERQLRISKERISNSVEDMVRIALTEKEETLQMLKEELLSYEGELATHRLHIVKLLRQRNEESEIAVLACKAASVNTLARSKAMEAFEREKDEFIETICSLKLRVAALTECLEAMGGFIDEDETILDVT